MRWLWIDRFLEFKSGCRAVAVKNVTLVEEAVDGYLPFYPMFPPSLIVEGLAQTGGLLVGEHNGYRERVVLAKLGRAVFHRPVQPGEQLKYVAEVEAINPQGAIVRGSAHVGDEQIADVELVFSHLDDRFPDTLFEPADVLGILRLFGLYQVGQTAEGDPLPIPEHLILAEEAGEDGD
jgi:3-hydroxyacyl-[acyl-carrier-protein] dehydratase